MIVSDVELVCVCVGGVISCLDLCFVMQLRYETEKINSQFPTKRDSIKKIQLLYITYYSKTFKKMGFSAWNFLLQNYTMRDDFNNT